MVMLLKVYYSALHAKHDITLVTKNNLNLTHRHMK
jgi:hypothetical protein